MDSNQKELTDWKELDSLDTVVKVIPKAMTGYFIEIKGEEYSTSPCYSFYGLSLLMAQSTHHD